MNSATWVSCCRNLNAVAGIVPTGKGVGSRGERRDGGMRLCDRHMVLLVVVHVLALCYPVNSILLHNTVLVIIRMLIIIPHCQS